MPHLLYPGPASKSLFEDFADHVDHDVEQDVSFQCNIDSMESFKEQYQAFLHILTQAVNDIFHHTSPIDLTLVIYPPLRYRKLILPSIPLGA